MARAGGINILLMQSNPRMPHASRSNSSSSIGLSLSVRGRVMQWICQPLGNSDGDAASDCYFGLRSFLPYRPPSLRIVCCRPNSFAVCGVQASSPNGRLRERLSSQRNFSFWLTTAFTRSAQSAGQNTGHSQSTSFCCSHSVPLGPNPSCIFFSPPSRHRGFAVVFDLSTKVIHNKVAGMWIARKPLSFLISTNRTPPKRPYR
jgi:hypothetical protein